jgi:hypothetical protein
MNTTPSINADPNSPTSLAQWGLDLAEWLTQTYSLVATEADVEELASVLIQARLAGPGGPAEPMLRVLELLRRGARHVVGGEFMERTLADFERACEVHIEEEQARPLPNNALIAVLCDAVRLSREHARVAKGSL